MGASASIEYESVHKRTEAGQPSMVMNSPKQIESTPTADAAEDDDILIKNLIHTATNTAYHFRLSDLKNHRDDEDNPKVVDDLIYYAKDLFFECAGDNSEIELPALQTLFEDMLNHLRIGDRRLRATSREQLSRTLMFALIDELKYEKVTWDYIEVLFVAIVNNIVQYGKLLETA
jgi:hypothetical protein